MLGKSIAAVILLGSTFTAATASAQSTAAKYGTRAPMTCAHVTLSHGPPSPTEAAKLAQCNSESDFGRSIYLMSNVKVEFGSPRPVETSDLLLAPTADAHTPVYPIRGMFTRVSCKQQFASSTFRGRNCTLTPVTEAEGLCWQTSFGDWRCAYGGRNARLGAAESDQPPPPDLRAVPQVHNGQPIR